MNQEEKKKKILMIYHGQGIGGGLIGFVALVKILEKEFEVDVFSIFGGTATEYMIKYGINVSIANSKFYKKYYNLFIHSEASYFSPLAPIRDFKNILTFLLSKYIYSKNEIERLPEKYDAVYLNSTFISDWSFSAKKLNFKTILHVREPLSKGFLGIRYSIIRKTIKSSSDNIISVSHDNKARLNLSEKTTVIYDPILPRINKNNIHDIKLGYKYFLYVGGDAQIKGFEQMVESLKYLNDNIIIIFLGHYSNKNEGLAKRYVKSILNPYSIKSKYLTETIEKSRNAIKIGLVDDVFDYYNASCALICPFSKPHAALPIIESYSLGKPVIASNIEGMEEFVTAETGLLFNNGDPKDLADKINYFSSLTDEKYLLYSNSSKEMFKKLHMEESEILEYFSEKIK